MLEKFIARDVLQKASIPRLAMGLNNIDTESIAGRKGRKWGATLHNSAKEHALQLHKAGEKDMTEQKYREKISSVLQNARKDMLGDISWGEEKVQAFFAAARGAFPDKV